MLRGEAYTHVTLCVHRQKERDVLLLISRKRKKKFVLTVQSRQRRAQRPKSSKDCERRSNPRRGRWILLHRHPTTSLTHINPATRAPFIYSHALTPPFHQ